MRYDVLFLFHMGRYSAEIHYRGNGGIIHGKDTVEVNAGSWGGAKEVIMQRYGVRGNDIYNLREVGGAGGLSNSGSSFSSSSGTDALFDVAGKGLVLGAKGLWKLGKFGVRKYQENKEDKLRQVREEDQLRLTSFFETPRVFTVSWKFSSSQELSLDGRQTLTLLEIPTILSRYIDDALDDVDDAPEVTAAWQTLLEACEKVKRDLVNNFPDNLSVHVSEKLCQLSASLTTPEDLYSITLLLARLLSRDGDELGSDAVKLQSRLNKSLKVLESICSESLWNTIELPPTPLTKEHFQELSAEQLTYPDPTNSSDFEEDDFDGKEFASTHDSEEEKEDNENSPFEYSFADEYVSEQASVTCETSTYGCIWYEREGFSLTPNPEGTLVISENKIFFVESDMDLAGVLAIVNNQVDDDAAVRWIFPPEAVSSITKSKVSFRSAYTLNTKSGGSYKMVFMPGKGESVIAKLRQLGIQTSF